MPAGKITLSKYNSNINERKDKKLITLTAKLSELIKKQRQINKEVYELRCKIKTHAYKYAVSESDYNGESSISRYSSDTDSYITSDSGSGSSSSSDSGIKLKKKKSKK